jgi:hypothetical protein
MNLGRGYRWWRRGTVSTAAWFSSGGVEPQAGHADHAGPDPLGQELERGKAAVGHEEQRAVRREA